MISETHGQRSRLLLLFILLLLAPTLFGDALAATLPANLANDPVTKALGAEVMSAAIKEGRVVWYAGDNTGEFFQAGGKEAFEKRFGIKMEPVTGRLREQTDRLRAEHAARRITAD